MHVNVWASAHLTYKSYIPFIFVSYLRLQQPLSQWKASTIQWCHLQVKVTLLFLSSPPFLPVTPLHNSFWIKISGYLSAYFIHHILWPYIPYLWWIVLSAVGYIVPTDRPSPPWCFSVLLYQVSFREPLISFRLTNILCDFLSVAGIWLQDLSGDRVTIFLSFSFQFISSCLAFLADLQVCICVCISKSMKNVGRIRPNVFSISQVIRAFFLI